jgi:hypothetical protein
MWPGRSQAQVAPAGRVVRATCSWRTARCTAKARRASLLLLKSLMVAQCNVRNPTVTFGKQLIRQIRECDSFTSKRAWVKLTSIVAPLTSIVAPIKGPSTPCRTYTHRATHSTMRTRTNHMRSLRRRCSSLPSSTLLLPTPRRHKRAHVPLFSLAPSARRRQRTHTRR